MVLLSEALVFSAVTLLVSSTGPSINKDDFNSFYTTMSFITTYYAIRLSLETESSLSTVPLLAGIIFQLIGCLQSSKYTRKRWAVHYSANYLLSYAVCVYFTLVGLEDLRMKVTHSTDRDVMWYKILAIPFSSYISFSILCIFGMFYQIRKSLSPKFVMLFSVLKIGAVWTLIILASRDTFPIVKLPYGLFDFYLRESTYLLKFIYALISFGVFMDELAFVIDRDPDEPLYTLEEWLKSGERYKFS